MHIHYTDDFFNYTFNTEINIVIVLLLLTSLRQMICLWKVRLDGVSQPLVIAIDVIELRRKLLIILAISRRKYTVRRYQMVIYYHAADTNFTKYSQQRKHTLREFTGKL